MDEYKNFGVNSERPLRPHLTYVNVEEIEMLLVTPTVSCHMRGELN